MKFVPRTKLPHDIPMWVADSSLYFITISCATRGTVDPQLTTPATAQSLLAAVEYYHAQLRWFARLFLLMPDHVHALLAFPQEETMRVVVSGWKRYTARQFGIRWQRDFFDHRLRNDENWELKAAYIRQNPVRKGLVVTAADWPWVFEPKDHR